MQLIVFILCLSSAAATSFEECQAGEERPPSTGAFRAAEVSALETEQQAIQFVQINAQMFQSSHSKAQEVGKQQHSGSVSDKSYDFVKVLHETDGSTLLQDPDYSLLGEKDAERVRFIAYHPQWKDVMDVWMDGFFQRYHSGDAGTWALQGDTLYLKWIGWEEEALITKDGGRNFVSSKNNFLLKNPAPDHWWLSHFDVNFRTDTERRSAMDGKMETKGIHLALAEAGKTRRDVNYDVAKYENRTGAALHGHSNHSVANLSSSVDVSKHFSGRRIALKEHVNQSGAELKSHAKIGKHESGRRKEVEENSTKSLAKLLSNADVAKKHGSEMRATPIRSDMHPAVKAESDEHGSHSVVQPFVNANLVEIRSGTRSELGKHGKSTVVKTDSNVHADTYQAQAKGSVHVAKGHGLGIRSTLGEHGYLSVAMLKSDAEMEVYMRRVIALLGHQISDENMFKSTVPDFSGVRNVQSYEALLDHLDKQALDPSLEKHYLSPASPAN